MSDDEACEYAEQVQALQGENARLRAALAQSELPCAYCSLPKEKWGECASGFPGCSRGDDALGCPMLSRAMELEELYRWRQVEDELPPMDGASVLLSDGECVVQAHWGEPDGDYNNPCWIPDHAGALWSSWATHWRPLDTPDGEEGI